VHTKAKTACGTGFYLYTGLYVLVNCSPQNVTFEASVSQRRNFLILDEHQDAINLLRASRLAASLSPTGRAFSISRLHLQTTRSRVFAHGHPVWCSGCGWALTPIVVTIKHFSPKLFPQ